MSLAMGEIAAGLRRGRQRADEERDEELEERLAAEAHDLEMEESRAGLKRTRQQTKQSAGKYAEWEEGKGRRRRRSKAATKKEEAEARRAAKENELYDYRLRQSEREENIRLIMQDANEKSAAVKSEEQLKQVKRQATQAARKEEFEIERNWYRALKSRGGRAAAELINEFEGNGVDDAHNIVEDTIEGKKVLRVVDSNGHPVIDPRTKSALVFDKEYMGYLYGGKGDFEVKETDAGELIVIDRSKGTIRPTGIKTGGKGKVALPGVGTIEIKDAIALWWKETGGDMAGLEGDRLTFEGWLEERKKGPVSDGPDGGGKKVPPPEGEDPPVSGAFWARNPNDGSWGWFVKRGGKTYIVGPGKSESGGSKSAAPGEGDGVIDPEIGKSGGKEKPKGQAQQTPRKSALLSQRTEKEKKEAAEKAKSFSLGSALYERKQENRERLEKAKSEALKEVEQLDSMDAIKDWRKKNLKKVPPEVRGAVWRALAKRKNALKEE